ncbi:MAG: pyruvoyl-dependent arginine decarboxylase, partial [Methanophagales archaeon]|nr:pyruvoyl-dependent arginine decarboxylase [Methanophagales archaeon]
MIPKAFFITSGVGMAHDQDAAFDIALQDAGIGECNLVEVSSILPAKAEEIDKMSCTPGEITFCVLSRMAGKSGELIGAGVGYGWLRDSTNSPVFGIICEHHGHHSRD